MTALALLADCWWVLGLVAFAWVCVVLGRYED